MSLTEKIKNKNSNVSIWFDENFALQDFIKLANEKIKNIKTILPKEQNGYPWSIVGHITEYMLALELTVPFTELYPMRYLKNYHWSEFERLSVQYSLSKNDTHKIINPLGILYKLALYESEIRRGLEVNLLDDVYLSKNVEDDLKNIWGVLHKRFNKDDRFVYNPHFNPFLTGKLGGADADLLHITKYNNTLLDLKTTKHSKIDKYMIWQLLGYTALDIVDEYKIKNIGLFLTRQNIIITLEVEDIIKEFSKFDSVVSFRNSFSNLILNK